MLRVTVTPELAALLAEIDRMKVDIVPVQHLSDEDRERWVSEYAASASYYGPLIDA